MAQRREKKSETLEVRLSYSEKQAFKEACASAGTTASQAVRGYIETVLHPGAASNRSRLWAAAVTLLMLVCAGLFYRLYTQPDTPPDPVDLILRQLDSNGDGGLSAADIQPDNRRAGVDWLITSGDTNGDGFLDLAELGKVANSVVLFRPTDSAPPATPTADGMESLLVFSPDQDAASIEAMLADPALANQLSETDRARLRRLVIALNASERAAETPDSKEAGAGGAIPPTNPD